MKKRIRHNLASRTRIGHDALSEARYTAVISLREERRQCTNVIPIDYAVKASADADFAKVEAVLHSLIQRLTANARQKAEDLLLPVRATLDKHIIPSVQRAQMDAKMILIAKLLNETTLFSYQDAEARLKAVQRVLSSLRLHPPAVFVGVTAIVVATLFL